MTAAADSSYSWFRMAISLALASIGGIGLWAGIITLPVIQQEFGVDRSGASLPYTLTMIGFAAGGILMGRVADRFGVMIPMIISTLTLSLGFVLAANAPNYWTYVFVQAGIVGFLGAATTFGPLVADISLWFKKHRGIAVSVVASGNYLAGAIWPKILTWSIAAYGWRQSYIAIGVLVLLTMLPLCLLLRPRANMVEQAGYTSSTGAATSSNFVQVMLVLAGLACCVAMSMPQVHLIAYCVDLGYGSERGAEMLSLLLSFGVVSRLASGIISDRIGGTKTLMMGSVLQCLALMLYVPFDGLASLYLVSILFGLSQGGIVPSYALIVRDNFPAREAGMRISLVLTATVLGMALGGWISGEIFDRTGSYTMAFVHGIAWNLLNIAIAFWLLQRRREQLQSHPA